MSQQNERNVSQLSVGWKAILSYRKFYGLKKKKVSDDVVIGVIRESLKDLVYLIPTYYSDGTHLFTIIDDVVVENIKFLPFVSEEHLDVLALDLDCTQQDALFWVTIELLQATYFGCSSFNSLEKWHISEQKRYLTRWHTDKVIVLDMVDNKDEVVKDTDLYVSPIVLSEYISMRKRFIREYYVLPSKEAFNLLLSNREPLFDDYYIVGDWIFCITNNEVTRILFVSKISEHAKERMHERFAIIDKKMQKKRFIVDLLLGKFLKKKEVKKRGFDIEAHHRAKYLVHNQRLYVICVSGRTVITVYHVNKPKVKVDSKNFRKNKKKY